MKSAFRRLAATAGAILLVGCGSRVPDDHTSLILSPGTNPGKPSKPLSMVWLHHSTGDALLRGGLLEALKTDGILFYDINYKQASVDGYVIGDHTDIPDWPTTFNTPKYFEVVKTWELAGSKAHHDIVMFKSCFPNSNITSDAMLERNKLSFDALIRTFEANPSILFIGMSTPPLVKSATTPDAARRAREWATWLTTDYGRNLGNVKVFDLFDALAIGREKPNANTLVPQFATSRSDSHPSNEGARAVTRLFIPWLNRVVREARLSE